MTTKKKSLGVMKTCWLQARVLAFVHTVLAQVIRWLGSLHTWLRRKSSCTSGELMKFVYLFFTFPVFQFSNFLFKLAYSLGEKHLLLLTGNCDFVGSHKLGGHLGNCGDQLIVVGKRLIRLYPIADYLKALECRIYFCVHGIAISDVYPNAKLRGAPFDDDK